MTSAESGRVTIEKDVVIGKGGARDIHADIYTPPNRPALAPAVLLVHGGGWRQGDREQLRGYGILLGRIGYVCVACEYRLSGEAVWPAQIHDVKAALRWMKANASRLRIDPAKIAVSGNSAGGHLSLMVGGTANVPEFEGNGGNPGVDTSVAAVISFYGPANLGRNAAELSEAVSMLMGKGATTEAVRAASPVSYLKATFPPTLLIHGNADELVPAEDSLKVYRDLAAAGVPVELHMYAGMPHAFDAQPAFGRQSAEIMALFLNRYVVQPSATPAVAASTGRA
jgi:acetyl esterase/lipase